MWFVTKTDDRQCGLLDGESVAVADDTGHVYILGVVEPLPDDNKLFLDVVADWQVDILTHSLNQSINQSINQSDS